MIQFYVNCKFEKKQVQNKKNSGSVLTVKTRPPHRKNTPTLHHYKKYLRTPAIDDTHINFHHITIKISQTKYTNRKSEIFIK